MRYPLGLVFDSARHLVRRRLRGERKIPIILTLDPFGACARGRQAVTDEAFAEHRAMLSVEQCLAAMQECDAPIVSICGGEPLEYPEIGALTRAILERGRQLFLCTDGTLIRRRLHMIPPYTNFFWNVGLDGTEAVHDGRVQKPGLFAEALDGVRAAKNAGFFVVVSSTVYPDSEIGDLEALYESLHEAHVDGYVLTPHYPGKKLCREGSARFHDKMHQRFREASERLSDFNLLVSPVYFEYLRGERELECCTWANPTYGPLGWTEPCALLNLQFAKSYKDLVEGTLWENYGRGLNPGCENCQSHAGYETAALLGASPKAGDFWKMLVWQLGGSLGEKRNGRRSA
jgi:hopanoid biosynthesis associated radical SAM protein HpnH